MATLPRLDDYKPSEAQAPDFIAAAVGFLGQFVLAPFLFIYAAILLVYVAQIAITQQLPQGTIGWMVLGFVVAGAGTWLVLHPPFIRSRPLVRLFRTSWFWLTLIPLALFFIAVSIRIDAYGWTSERLVLVSGGAWAAMVSATFLIGRGDVRLIPGLACAILVVFSFGPWSYLAAPDHDQGSRLGRLLALKADPTATVSVPEWTTEQVAEARSAIHYLDSSEHGRRKLSRVLLDHGFIYDPLEDNPYDLLAELGYPETMPRRNDITFASRDVSVPVDVAATPFYLGHREAWAVAPSEVGFQLSLAAGSLAVHRDGMLLLNQPLRDWAARQRPDGLAEPWIDFTVEGVGYRLVLNSASWRDDPATDADPREVNGLTGELFADDGTLPIPTP